MPESRSQSVAKSSYDVQGAVAITLGTMALVFTLIKADSWGWTSTRTIAGFVVAAVLIVAFVVIERGHDDPLVPLRIFSNRSLSASDATMLLVVAALFGMFFFVTLYLQQVLRYSALKTGVAYLPLSLTLSRRVRRGLAICRTLHTQADPGRWSADRDRRLRVTHKRLRSRRLRKPRPSRDDHPRRRLWDVVCPQSRSPPRAAWPLGTQGWRRGF